MDLDSLHIQIFVSLILVLGALFVALVCDFLKGNNEVLREHTIELTVRQEERSKHDLGLAPTAAKPETQERAIRPPAVVLAPPPPPFVQERPEPLVQAAVKQTSERTPGRATTQTIEQESKEPPQPAIPVVESLTASLEPPPAPPRFLEYSREVPESKPRRGQGLSYSKVTPIDLLERSRAIDAAPEPQTEVATGLDEAPSTEPETIEVQLAAIEGDSRPLFVDLATVEPEPSLAQLLQNVQQGESSEEVEVARQEEVSFQAELIQEFEETCAESPAEESSNASTEDAAVIPVLEPDEASEHDQQGLLVLPRGMQDPTILAEALKSTIPFRGTVIAVGFNSGKPKPVQGKSQVPQETTLAVERLLESLLGDHDTGFRSAEDEYLMVLPNERGANAQRRQQYVSESLWDYQIRSVGAASILFYWGASEVEHELLSAAVASAKERMYQTRRTRERPPAEIHHYRLNVVRS